MTSTKQKSAAKHAGSEQVAEAKKKSPAASSATTTSFDRDYLKSYYTDTKHILTSPARWDGADWTKASLVLGATGALYAVDNKTRSFFQANRTSATDELSRGFRQLGDGFVLAGGMGVSYLYGSMADSPRAKETALLGLESFVLSGVMVNALKYVTGRHRPSTGDPAGTWDGPGSKNYSFPSGHSVAAFSVATMIAEEYAHQPLTGALAYGAAAMVGLSRVNDNKHWMSDVLLGGAIGYFTSKTIFKLHQGKKRETVFLSPTMDGQGAGMRLTVNY